MIDQIKGIGLLCSEAERIAVPVLPSAENVRKYKAERPLVPLNGAMASMLEHQKVKKTMDSGDCRIIWVQSPSLFTK